MGGIGGVGEQKSLLARYGSRARQLNTKPAALELFNEEFEGLLEE